MVAYNGGPYQVNRIKRGSLYIENLSAAASSKLLQLFTSMSSPSFLLANDSNHDLLRALLEAMNSIIEHKYKSKQPSSFLPRTCEVFCVTVHPQSMIKTTYFFWPAPKRSP